MLAADATLGEHTHVAPSSILQAKVRVSGEQGKETVIGEGNIVEDWVSITNSQIGSDNLIEVKCSIEESTIGNSCKLAPGCRIIRCQIGNCVTIAAGIELVDATIGDNNSVYMDLSGAWMTRSVQNYNPLETLLPMLKNHYGPR